MSGTSDDRELLAGEYVLGVLDPATAASVADQARSDPALAAAIAAWQARLDPLTDSLAPVPPSAGLWSRIEGGMAPRPSLPAPRAPGIWRPLAIGSLAMAACLAIALIALLTRPAPRPPVTRAPVVPARPVPPPATPAPEVTSKPPAPAPAKIVRTPPPSVPVATVKPPPVVALPTVQGPSPVPVERRGDVAVAILARPNSSTALLRVSLASDHTLRVSALRAVSIPPDRQMELWAWPPGEAAPLPLGRLDPAGGSFPYPYKTQDGTPVMATEEPADTALSATPGRTLALGFLATLR